VLLNKKDVVAEEFINRLLDEVVASLPDHLSEAEKSQQISNAVLSRLHEMGSSLVVKLGSLVKTMVDYREMQGCLHDLASISVPDLTVLEKAALYRRMFFRFLDPESVSFRVHDSKHLGGLTHEELFILTYFVFATCQRTACDGLLQLYISGVTSTGKTKLIETPLLPSAHQLVSSSGGTDAGVGRFTTRSKSILILHDVSIGVLFSADMSALKALARAEQCAAKVHSSTEMVGPVFLLVSSNDRMFDHRLPPAKAGQLPTRLPSQILQTGSKRPKQEHVDAMCSRFLELHVRKASAQDPDDLRQADGFRKIHLVLALYDRVLEIAGSKRAQDFGSKHFYHYVVSALEKCSATYCRHTDAKPSEVAKSLLQLKKRFGMIADDDLATAVQ